MAFEIHIIGSNDLQARWRDASSKLAAKINAAMQTQMTRLSDYVRLNKLSGSPLNRRSGNLSRAVKGKSSIQGNRVVGTVGFSGTEVPYGVYWEETGIRAHTVVPVNAKALRFQVGGDVVFAKSVHIPTQAPRPFLKPALEENRARIAAAIRTAAIGALRK